MSRLRDSLIGRLSLYVLGGMLLVWSLLTLALYLQMWHEVGEMQSAQLVDVGELLIRHLDDETEHGLRKTDAISDKTRMAFSLYDRQGKLIATSHFPPLPPLAPLDAARPHYETERGLVFHGESWRVRRFANANHQLTIGASEQLRRGLALEMATQQMLPLALMLALCMAITLWSLRRGLSPLNNFSAELQARHPGNLAAINTPLPTEVIPLAARINALFRQIEETLQRERRFTGDAAHELRTPLAGLKLQLELAIGNPREETRERALHNVQTSTERMEHLVDQLLKLARLDDARQLPLAPIDLPALCREALAQHQLHGEVIVTTAARWQGDAGALRLLLRNLFDNIRRHAGTASPVEIQIAAGTICIRDHGPGVDPDWLQRLGERFARPEGEHRDGVGLGLSIAHRIAQLHGSGLSFSLPEDGGLAVCFQIPSSPLPEDSSSI
ncbi:sensor histidine kinase family protein [Chitinimonas naiadis]